jgi:tRNA(His) 5'-end guanylyltransferase
MNSTLLERLRSFQIPSAAPVKQGHFLVARLNGIDFAGILDSPEFGFDRPFDPEFGKMMIRTASHLLGGDACGRYAFVEQLEMSVLLNHDEAFARWEDTADLQSFLVAGGSSKMSLLVEDEALFLGRLFSFSKSELVISYFMWRQQEAYLAALERYCSYVLAKEGSTPETVANILEGLGPLEKEEILRQHGIEYSEIPAWQRRGAAVSLAEDGERIKVDTNLPKDNDYRPYLQQQLE